MLLYTTFPVKVFGLVDLHDGDLMLVQWLRYSPLMDPVAFGTFNYITSVDRNRSNFQNLMFQKLKIYNFQNNSHVYCKIPLSETFRLREQSFWILLTLYCWISGFFQTPRTRQPVMQCHISEDRIVSYMA